MRQRSPIASICIVLALLCFPGISNAATVYSGADLGNNKKAAEYLYSRALMESMYQLGVTQDRGFNLHLDCTAQYRIKPLGLVVLSRIEFPDNGGNPTKGIWQERYELERCGDSKVYNAIFTADAAGAMPSARAFYPGASNASATLIRDALVSAFPGAIIRSGQKDCKNADVFDMRVVEEAHDVTEGGKSFKGVWKETWTFWVCGKTVDVGMTFIPDASGGGATFKSDVVDTAAPAKTP